MTQKYEDNIAFITTSVVELAPTLKELISERGFTDMRVINEMLSKIGVYVQDITENIEIILPSTTRAYFFYKSKDGFLDRDDLELDEVEKEITKAALEGINKAVQVNTQAEDEYVTETKAFTVRSVEEFFNDFEVVHFPIGKEVDNHEIFVRLQNFFAKKVRAFFENVDEERYYESNKLVYGVAQYDDYSHAFISYDTLNKQVEIERLFRSLSEHVISEFPEAVAPIKRLENGEAKDFLKTISMNDSKLNSSVSFPLKFDTKEKEESFIKSMSEELGLNENQTLDELVENFELVFKKEFDTLGEDLLKLMGLRREKAEYLIGDEFNTKIKPYDEGKELKISLTGTHRGPTFAETCYNSIQTRLLRRVILTRGAEHIKSQMELANGRTMNDDFFHSQRIEAVKRDTGRLPYDISRKANSSAPFKSDVINFYKQSLVHAFFGNLTNSRIIFNEKGKPWNYSFLPIDSSDVILESDINFGHKVVSAVDAALIIYSLPGIEEGKTLLEKIQFFQNSSINFGSYRETLSEGESHEEVEKRILKEIELGGEEEFLHVLMNYVHLMLFRDFTEDVVNIRRREFLEKDSIEFRVKVDIKDNFDKKLQDKAYIILDKIIRTEKTKLVVGSEGKREFDDLLEGFETTILLDGDILTPSAKEMEGKANILTKSEQEVLKKTQRYEMVARGEEIILYVENKGVEEGLIDALKWLLATVDAVNRNNGEKKASTLVVEVSNDEGLERSEEIFKLIIDGILSSNPDILIKDVKFVR